MNDIVSNAAVQPQTWSRRTQAPFVSVLLPVRNEAAFIEETLERLLEQEYDPNRYEILVADGRSTDETRQLVAAFQEWHPQIISLDNPRQWSSAGRNAGLRVGRGDFFLVIDGHCALENRRYLADLVDAFLRSGADCIGRPQPLDVTGAGLLQRCIAAGRASRLGHHPDSRIYSDSEGFVPPQSVAVAYRRSVFERVGLFDESFDACEDVELNHRVAGAGLSCFFTPRAAVKYIPRSTVASLFRQMVRYGRGRVRLLRKHPETFTAAGFVPAAFVAGLMLGPLAACWIQPLWWPWGGGLGLYAALVLAASAWLARRQGEAMMMLVLPVVFAAIHLGAGWGIVRELVRGSTGGTVEEMPRSLPQRQAA